MPMDNGAEKAAILMFAMPKKPKKGVTPPTMVPSKSDNMDMSSENGHDEYGSGCGCCEDCGCPETCPGCEGENCPNCEPDSEETPMPENGKKGKMGLEAIKMMLKKALEEE